MTTSQDITAFIDQWLVEHRDQVSDVSLDFALDLRILVEQLSELDIPEPVGV